MNRDLSELFQEQHALLTRRQLFGRGASGLGLAALSSLLGSGSLAAPNLSPSKAGLPGVPHFQPRAKRVIFLCQSGAPSQVDLFDPKPGLQKWHGEELPDSVRRNQRLTGMTASQKIKPVTASPFKFKPAGKSGVQLSELIPFTSKIADELCLVRSMQTDAINHDPAITLLQTGSQQAGHPSMGSWMSYGLGSESENLPTFVVFISGGSPGDQPLMGRLWGSGFLPSRHQGVKFRAGRDPVLYLSNPPGIDQARRRSMLDATRQLNSLQADLIGDPEIQTRVAQFEQAFRMQRSIPEVADISSEPKHVLDLYGPEAQQPGSYAANCLMARRLVERGVRFVQLYHRGWDHHEDLPSSIRNKCRQTDQPSAALVQDLKQRGLLKDTLVVWAGEFGRTVYCQGKLTKDNYGRDHHPRCFSIWMAGGGVRAGLVHGKTDEYSYNIVKSPVHVHDLQATIMHCLGIDHQRLTFRFQGRDHRLTDVHGNVVKEILS